MSLISLVDPHSSGHHLTYLRYFSLALLEMGHHVVVLTSDAVRVRELVEPGLTAEQKCCFKTVDYQEHFTRGRYAGKNRDFLRTVLQRLDAALGEVETKCSEKIDLVFFPYLDSYIGYSLSANEFHRCLGRRYSGLYFNPQFLRIKPAWWFIRDYWRDYFREICGSGCPAVAVLDEGVVNELTRRLNGKAVIPCPDFTTYEKLASTDHLTVYLESKRRGRFTIGIFGSLDKRKGVMEFISLARRAPATASFFLLVGRVNFESFSEAEAIEIRKFITSPPDNCFVLARFLASEADLNALICHCDLVWAVYHNFCHSSNMLTKAAGFRIPVLVADGFLMAERVRKFSLGYVLDGDLVEGALKFMDLRSLSQLRTSQKFVTGCHEYAQMHDAKQLLVAMRRLVAECLPEAEWGHNPDA